MHNIGIAAPQELQPGSLNFFGEVSLDASQVKTLWRNNSELLDEIYGQIRRIDPIQNLESKDVTVERGEAGIKIMLDGKELLVPQEQGKGLERSIKAICCAAKQCFPVLSIPAPEPNQPHLVTREITVVGLHWKNFARTICTLMNEAPDVIPFLAIVSAWGGIYLNWQAQTLAGQSREFALKRGDKEGALIARITRIAACLRIPAALCPILSNLYFLLNLSSIPRFISNNIHYLGKANAVLSIGVGLLTVGSTIYQGLGLGKFRSNLHRICEWGASEHTRAVQALEFLHQELILTEEEVQKCHVEAAKNGTPVEKILENKRQTKYQSLARKVGTGTASKIAADSGKLLEALKTGENPDVTLAEAKNLINAVDQESFKIRVKQITTIVISILSIAAAVLSMVFVPAAPILLAVSYVLMTTNDFTMLHNKIGECLWRVTRSWSWGKSTAVPGFQNATLGRYYNGENWHLQRLQEDVNASIKRAALQGTYFKINGQNIKDFDACKEALGLQGLDFNRNSINVGDEQQQKALIWLSMMAHKGIKKELLAQHPNQAAHWTKRGQLNVGLMYNPQMGTGRIRAFRQPERGPSLWCEITANDARVWESDVRVA
jgi:hypothetical protein